MLFTDVLNDPVVQNLILDDAGTDETVKIGPYFLIKRSII